MTQIINFLRTGIWLIGDANKPLANDTNIIIKYATTVPVDKYSVDIDSAFILMFKLGTLSTNSFKRALLSSGCE